MHISTQLDLEPGNAKIAVARTTTVYLAIARGVEIEAQPPCSNGGEMGTTIALILRDWQARDTITLFANVEQARAIVAGLQAQLDTLPKETR